LIVDYVLAIEWPDGPEETPLVSITPWGRMVASAYRQGLPRVG